jgi:hypothetical protein
VQDAQLPAKYFGAAAAAAGCVAKYCVSCLTGRFAYRSGPPWGV